MQKRLSIFMIFLLMLQTIVTGFIPSQVIFAEGSKNHKLFDFENITDSSYVQEDGDSFLEVDWSLANIDLEEVEQKLDFNSPVELIEQEGILLVEGEAVEIASFKATKNVISVTLHEEAAEHPQAKGTLKLQIPVEEEVVEEDLAEEAIEEEVVEEDTAEEVTEEEVVEEDPTEEAIEEEVVEEDSAEEVTEEEVVEEDPTEEAIEEEVVEEDSAEEVTEEEIVEEEAAEEVTEEEVEEEDATEKVTEEEKEKVEKTNIGTFSAVEITENIITDVELKIDGEVLGDGDPITVAPPFNGLDVELTYNFELPNDHGYGDGSTYTIEVPEMFNIPQVSASDAQELARADGTVFGTFYTEGNNVIITFNENIENESNISGEIILESNFDEDYDGLADGDKITFPLEDGTKLEFPIKFIPDANVIEKSGVGNRGYNTETITWTVDINKNLQEINGATLEDEITQGEHSFVNGSLKVYELTMNADGTVARETEVPNHNFGSEFPLDLGDINSAYRFVYETEVNDATGTNYQNKVTLDGDNVDSSETTASVNVTRGEPLAKDSTGYDDVTQTIDWEVRYNYDEKTISQEQAKLQDNFGNDNLELVPNSLQVITVNIDPDTGNPTDGDLIDPSQYTVVETDDGFEFQFNDDIDGAYKITYQTRAIDRVEGNIAISNTISDEFENTQTGDREITQGIFIKSHGAVDYAEKETDWSILINRDEHVMENVVVTDTLPVGFTPRDIVVTHGGSTWAEGNQYNYNYDSDSRAITITFNQDLTERVDIRYTTDIDFDAAGRDNEHKNIAHLTWGPDGDEQSGNYDGEATFNPDDYTQNNGFKHGSYNMVTKEITWTIGVNYNNETLEGVTVEDFILGDQNFDINNVKVYEMTLTGDANGYELGNDVTSSYSIIEENGPNEEDGFSVILGDITRPYVIKYTTSLEGEHVAATYNNEATVSTTNGRDIELDATVNPNHGGEYVNKHGQQNNSNGRIVNWSIDLNFSQSRVIDYEIVDMLSVNQTIRQETLIVYGTIVSGGQIVKDESNRLVEGTDYEITFTEEANGQESYKLRFLDEIEKAYVLEYDSYILYEGDGKYSNSANVSGTIPGDETQTSDTVDTNISFNNISGNIRGDVGSLQITKVDADDDNKTLEGAVFELWDEAGNVLLKTATTDENGVATFTNLLYTDYQLKESEAPDGYVVNVETNGIETVAVNGNLTEHQVINHEIKRHVELTKADGTDGAFLDGVGFELRNAEDDSVVGTYTTDEDGVIYIEDLDPGDYYFVETSPAQHYQENNTQYPFTIESEQIVIDEVSVQNELIPGSAFIQKVDADTGMGLSGAEFDILDGNGNLVRSVTASLLPLGLVNTGDLRPGDYQLVETQAPRGFEIPEDAEPIDFTIELSQGDPLDLGMIEGAIENEVKTTSIALTKRDAINDQLLEDAVFEITYADGVYDLENDPQQASTDENGVVTFEDLKPGTYEITEVSAPNGYILNSDPIEVVVTLDHVANEQLVTSSTTNAPYANITLQKIDADTGYSDLAGAVFDVVDPNTGDPIDGFTGFTTNSNGQISITGLPEGTYQLQEAQAPNGYEIQGDGLTEQFTVTAGTDTDVIEIGDFENDIITGSVQLTKVDGDTGNVLEGVEFTLNAESLVNGGTYTETTHFTDENGQIEVSDLRPGTYVFEEVAPLNDDYQPHTGEIRFTIDFNADNPSIPIEVDVANYQLVDIPVTKQWEDNFIDADNAAQRPESITVELLQDGEVEDTVVLDAGNWSHTFEGLDAFNYSEGQKYEYTVRELDQEGYDSEITGNVENGFNITNTAKSTSLELTKEDSINGHLLSGAEFTLTYPDGTTELEITDSNGRLTFTDLQPGIYELVETAEPEGYIANPNPIEIIVTLDNVENGTVLTETVENNPFANVTFTKVDAETNVALSEAEFKVVDADGDDVEGFTNLAVENDGTLSITGLPAGDYKLVETSAPTGYELSDVEVEFTVEAGSTTELIELGDFDNEITRGSVTFTKINDDDETLGNVEFLLEGTDLVNDDDNYSETHYTDADGVMLVESLRPGTYTFTEVYPDGYQHYTGEDLTFTIDPVNGETDVTLGNADGEVINYALIDIPVEKVWNDDGQEDLRSDVTVELLRDGSPTGDTITLTSDDDWKDSFTGLDVVDPSNGNEYIYTVAEQDVDGYQRQGAITGNAEDGFVITNVLLRDISVEKVWLDNDNATGDRPANIEIELYQNETLHSSETIIGIGDTWNYTFENLPVYDENGDEYKYTIEEPNYDANYSLKDITGTMDEGFEVENVRTGTISVTGEKTWLDDNNSERPGSIEVELTRNVNGTPDEDFSQQQEVESEDWNYEFTGLDRFDENGVEYTYEVKEINVPTGYESSEEGHDITNLRVGTIDVEGEKIWLDDNDPDRPEEIEVILNQNGSEIDRKTITAADNWSYSFTDLPEFNNQGEAYTYTVEEGNVPTGYEVSYDQDNYEITNLRVGTTSVSGTKEWLDDEDATGNRPEVITVNLLQNGTKVDSLEVEAGENDSEDWSYSFTGLAEFDENGVAYEYTVEEEAVSGYEVSYNGYNLTNLRVGITSVEGTKEWLDDNDATGDRPESITVHLYQDGTRIDTQEDIKADEDGDWTYSFTGLDQFNDQGEAYNYWVQEEAVDGYDTSYDGNDITNLRVGKVDVDVTKTWQDDDPNDRPDSVTVNLLQNGTVVDTQDIDAAMDWEYSFTGLAEFDSQGVTYEYMITEHDVPGYNSAVDGYEITNTRSEERDITVTKSWLDDESEDRPEEITVDLIRNGDEENPDQTVQVTEADGWTHTFDNLPAYDNSGQAINYTVKEHEIEGYEATINGFDITNVRVGTVEIEGEKTWLDDNDATGDRPTEIEVILNQNGSELTRQTVTATDDWNYSFTDLDEFNDQGEPYTYTVREVAIDGYEANYDGYNIENVRTGTIEVNGEKTWLDGNNPDRPTEIEVILNQNGSEVARQTVTIADNWSYSFPNLDEFDEKGVAYEYTVEEEAVAGYQVSYDDSNNIINTLLTDIDVEKTWLDNSDAAGDRPEEITVSLYQNGTRLADEDVTITADEDWSHTFTALPAYDENDELITYTVEESYDEANYRLTETNGDMDTGFELVNVRLIDIDVTKTWQDDNPEDRPQEITVNLLQNGTVVDTQDIDADMDWKYSFTDLAEFDSQGEAYEYTVTEHDVPGYDSEVDGYEITNTRSEERDITVTKAWLDDESEDRPTEINVDLLQNDDVYETVSLTAEGWSYEFESLPAYDENGQAYIYTVEEHDVDNYETTINGFDITNLRVGTISVEGTKTWLDDEDATGDRPSEIEVILNQNGSELTRQTVTANSDWEYSFADLAEFDDQGVAYTYSIEEVVPPGYEASYDGNDITNIRAGIIDVDVTKTWQDDDSIDRPSHITVNLLQNGTVVDTQNINASMNWEYSFTGLAEFDANGVAYEYTVTEQDVPGYDSEVDGYEITNTRSEERDITVTKAWLDDDAEDRPTEITVDLLQNNDVYETVSLTAAGEWKYTFEDLPAYNENGQAYTYAVEEHDVEGYNTTINGFDITNVRTGTVDVDVTKTWLDNEDAAENRPSEIEVILNQNGSELTRGIVTEAADWKYSFTDLAEFDEQGVAYSYTVEEAEIRDYVLESITGDSESGYDITNRPAKVSVGDYVWIDENGDGLQDGTDTPLEGVVLIIEDEEGNPVTDVYGNLVGPTTTDKNGNYIFENLPIDKTYKVRIDQEKSKEVLRGYEPTLHEVGDENTVDSSTWEVISRHLEEDGEHDPTLDFGFVKSKKVSVGDYVWIDVNRDGFQDDTDIPLAGVVLKLVDENEQPVIDVYGDPVGPTTTDKNGWYTFENLPADNTYTVIIDREASAEALEGYIPTLEEAGDDNTVDSSTWEATSRYLEEDGEHDPTLDFGFVRKQVSVGDYVWIDVNGDGLQDDTDIKLPGVVLEIFEEDGETPVIDVYGNKVGPTTTDKNGYYIFENLPADKTYVVKINRELSAKALEGLEPTLHEVGDDNSIDSSTWFAVSRHLVEDGEHDPTLDFGFIIPTEPEEPVDPEDPSESEKPEEPSKPGDSDQSKDDTPVSGEGSKEDGDSTKDEDKSGSLPDTATNTFNIMLIGTGILLLGLILYMTSRRARKNN